MTTTLRWILVILAVAGLAAAVTSLYVHAQLLNQPGYTSFCDVSTTVRCTQVYQSKYATVGGVPVALFAGLWYVALLILLAGSTWGWESLRANALTYVFLMSLPAMGAVGFLAYVSLVVLKTVCPMCVLTYVTTTGIFAIAAARFIRPFGQVGSRMTADWKSAAGSPPAMTVLMVFIIGATMAIAFVPRPGEAKRSEQAKGTGDPKADFVTFWESQPRVEIPIATDGASVVVIKFSDFMCPGCAQSYVDHKALLAKYTAQYPGDFKFILRDYPLETECNPSVPADKHQAACEAAVAARLARARGRGEAMEEWLYARNQSLTPDAVRQGARDVGGVTDYDAQYATIIDQIKRDIAPAATVGIKATPTFFIGHKAPGQTMVLYVRAEGSILPEYLEQMIQYELKKAGKLAP